MVQDEEDSKKVRSYAILKKSIYEILMKNIIFKLFNKSKIHYFILSSLISSIIFEIGFLISIRYDFVEIFINLKMIYVLIFGIFSAFISMGWFSKNFINIISNLKSIFIVSDEDYINIIFKWSRLGFNNYKLILLNSIFWISLGNYSLFRYLMIDNILLKLYVSLLVSLCGFILGIGVIAYVSHFILIKDIFQNEIDFTYIYGKLKTEITSLANFCLITATTGSIALGYLIMLTIEKLSYTVLLIVSAGIFVTLLSYIIPQISIHRSIYIVKEKELIKINSVFYKYYDKIVKNNYDIKDDEMLNLSVLLNLRNDIVKMPTWIFNTKELIKMCISLLVPIISLVIKLF